MEFTDDETFHLILLYYFHVQFLLHALIEFITPAARGHNTHLPPSGRPLPLPTNKSLEKRNAILNMLRLKFREIQLPTPRIPGIPRKINHLRQ